MVTKEKGDVVAARLAKQFAEKVLQQFGGEKRQVFLTVFTTSSTKVYQRIVDREEEKLKEGAERWVVVEQTFQEKSPDLKEAGIAQVTRILWHTSDRGAVIVGSAVLWFPVSG